MDDSALTAGPHDGRRRQQQEQRRQGLGRRCTVAAPRHAPPPCTSEPNARIPFASPHPYGNNGDCPYTCDNGSAGFRFHFSLLDTEADYVYSTGLDGPCIPTSTGSVNLVSDAGATAQGFTVDAVEP